MEQAEGHHLTYTQVSLPFQIKDIHHWYLAIRAFKQTVVGYF